MVSAHLAAQISHSVQWTKIIDILRQKEDMQFLEVGPGNVLSGLLKRIEKEFKNEEAVTKGASAEPLQFSI